MLMLHFIIVLPYFPIMWQTLFVLNFRSFPASNRNLKMLICLASQALFGKTKYLDPGNR